MANTPDLAPSRKRTTGSSVGADVSAAAAEVRTEARETQLESQIAQLQSDLKAVAATLAKLTGEKVDEARAVAKGEMRHLRQQGQGVLDDVQSQAHEVEKQLTDTIREKPLTAVASAVGIGFILALLTRR